MFYPRLGNGYNYTVCKALGIVWLSILGGEAFLYNSQSDPSVGNAKACKALFMRGNLRFTLFGPLFLLLFGAGLSSLQAQTRPKEKKEKPNQLDVFKINIGQFFINEARISYEKELSYQSSIEIGAGYIYRNTRLYNQSGNIMLSSGWGVEVSFRKYQDKKSFIYESAFRTYFSPVLYYKNSAYADEWFILEVADTSQSSCTLQSERFHQLGLRLIFGFQSRKGRIVLDGYGGLGVKYLGNITTEHAFNEGSKICEIGPNTQFPEAVFNQNDIAATVHLGVKIGIRGNNKEKPEGYYDKIREQRDEPPAFRP